MKMNRSIPIVMTALLALTLMGGCSGDSSSSDGMAASSGAESAVSAVASATVSESGWDESVSGDEGTLEGDELVLTVDELAMYNGKDGMPAYVAVDGLIYDVTDVPDWENGEHYSGLTAGNDLTEEIKNDSPHGLSVLDDLPMVGKLA